MSRVTQASPRTPPARGDAATRVRPQAGRSQSSATRRNWLFLAPLAAVNLLVVAGPAVATVYYSLTEWNGLSAPTFIGFANYVELVQDTRFLNAVGHNLYYAAFMLIVPITMALFGAFMLSSVRRFRLLFRTLYFVPYIVLSVVNASIWKYLLSPETGIAAGLNQVGIHWLDDVYFLGDTDLALTSVAFVDNWHWWGFLVVLFLAAMQDVDKTLYESVRLDGASRFQEFWHVTFPSIRPTFVFVVVLTIIWSFLAFDYAYVLTRGGPADASMLVSILLNANAFSYQRAGYASAMGVAMTSFTVVVLSVYTWLRKRGWEI